MAPHFALVKGANRWRVIEWVATNAGVTEYIYATDPLKTKGEAVSALLRFQKVAAAVKP